MSLAGLKIKAGGDVAMSGIKDRLAQMEAAGAIQPVGVDRGMVAEPDPRINVLTISAALKDFGEAADANGIVMALADNLDALLPVILPIAQAVIADGGDTGALGQAIYPNLIAAGMYLQRRLDKA